VAVVVTLLILNLTDVLRPEMALRLFLLIEVPLILVFAAITFVRFRNLGRSAGPGNANFLDRLKAEEPMVRPALSEIRSMWSLCLAIARRRRVPPGSAPFGYTRGTFAMPAVMLALCLGELVVVHFIVPWQWLRIVLLVLTVWGALFIFGFFAARRVHPHFVSTGALHLRWGYKNVLTTPTSNILSVEPHANHTHAHPFAEGSQLVLTQFQSTNVRIRLAAPVPADPPVAKKDAIAGFKASEVLLHVDDPDAFVNALTPHGAHGTGSDQKARPAYD